MANQTQIHQTCKLVEMNFSFDNPKIIKEWIKELLLFCIRDYQIIVGGVFLLQQHTNRKIKFLIKKYPKVYEKLSSNVSNIINNFWNENCQDTKTQVIEFEGKKIQLSYVPVSYSFNLPVGYFWAVYECTNIDSVRGALEIAAYVTSLALLSEKSKYAIDFLGKPIWLQESTKIQTINEIVDVCIQALSCQFAIVWIQDDTKNERKTLRTQVSRGLINRNVKVDMPFGTGVAGKCASEKTDFLIKDLLNQHELHDIGVSGLHLPEFVKTNNLRSAIFVPLAMGEDVIGVMGMFDNKINRFSQVDLSITKAFSRILAAGYAHVRRFEELKEIERKLDTEAPTFQAGILALEGIHDAEENIILAQNYLSGIINRFSRKEENKIRKDAEKAAEFIDNSQTIFRKVTKVTKLSKYELRKIEKNRVNLKDLLVSLIELIKPLTDKPKINIYLDCEEELIVYGDRDLLERVFRNLLDNSIYWLTTDRKGQKRRIEIKCKREDDKVIIRIWDNGPGIQQSDRDKIYSYSYTTKGYRGMGFGLPIAKRIIEAHDGKIAEDTKWGYWTEFAVTLPIR
jgi:signal transduction histidine kinase